jgi:hypothetical protein
VFPHAVDHGQGLRIQIQAQLPDRQAVSRPGSRRAWVAITMNRIRSHWHIRQAVPAVAGLQDLHDVAEAGADFVELMIVRRRLQGQRQEVPKPPLAG